jgi:cyclic pyranopterin phosphate synthase
MRKKPGMIDVGRKKKTKRMAKARIFVRLSKELIKKIKHNTIPKGNVLETARIAGIMAAKKTDGLIPLCHNIEIEYANIEFVFKGKGLLIESEIKTTAKTGVEMEAMAGCSAAALTVYDMCKMFTKSIEITDFYLVEKRGGKSGIFKRKSG